MSKLPTLPPLQPSTTSTSNSNLKRSAFMRPRKSQIEAVQQRFSFAEQMEQDDIDIDIEMEEEASPISKKPKSAPEPEVINIEMELAKLWECDYSDDSPMTPLPPLGLLFSPQRSSASAGFLNRPASSSQRSPLTDISPRNSSRKACRNLFPFQPSTLVASLSKKREKTGFTPPPSAPNSSPVRKQASKRQNENSPPSEDTSTGSKKQRPAEIQVSKEILCMKCNKVIYFDKVNSQSLYSHVIIHHTNFKRFKCPIPKCRMESKQRSTISVHLVQVHGIQDTGEDILEQLTETERCHLRKRTTECFPAHVGGSLRR